MYRLLTFQNNRLSARSIFQSEYLLRNVRVHHLSFGQCRIIHRATGHLQPAKIFNNIVFPFTNYDAERRI